MAPDPHTTRLKDARRRRGWSQEQLAERAAVSRAEVSAIEVGRVVPSVTVALHLAAALGCSVEDLFRPEESQEQPAWAWPSTATRYWMAEVGGRVLRYPAESLAGGGVPHDGVTTAAAPPIDPARTLVVASCDPAPSLLAAEYARATGFRMLVFPRGGRQAAALLNQRLVHVAGLHFATADRPDGNARCVKDALTGGHRLLRSAVWQAGLSLAPGGRITTVHAAVSTRLRWVGREAGSAARACQDELLATRPAPRRTALDHRGVAVAVRAGWADVGVCHRLASDEAGLAFLPVREELFDLCFSVDHEADPRLVGLVRLVRSPDFRKLLGELPGYATAQSGDLATVA